MTKVFDAKTVGVIPGAFAPDWKMSIQLVREQLARNAQRADSPLRTQSRTRPTPQDHIAREVTTIPAHLDAETTAQALAARARLQGDPVDIASLYPSLDDANRVKSQLKTLYYIREMPLSARPPLAQQMAVIEKANKYLMSGAQVDMEWRDEATMYLLWLDWKPLLAQGGLSGARAQELWLSAVIRELTDTIRFTFSIIDADLLAYLPDQTLEILVREYMWRMGTIVTNMDKLRRGRLANHNTPFHRQSFNQVNNFFHQVMDQAWRRISQNKRRFSDEALEMVEIYDDNRTTFQQHTQEIEENFPADSPFIVPAGVA